MIGYYIHHHGRGHTERATGIAAAMRSPVVALSSLDLSDRAASFADRVVLPRDDQDPAGYEHHAGGALHWAPLGAPGYRERMAVLAQWLATARPRLVVVDVSVEVALLCRTLGVPVVVVAGAGERADPVHELVYRLATRIVAPWPGAIYEPPHLREHAAKTSYVGAFSRFDHARVTQPPGRRNVAVLFGAGGSNVAAEQLAEARAATTGWTWHTLGLAGAPWCTDVWGAMSAADVVVTHAGQNALAEVAAARRPAVVVAQDRPFGEQAATAAALGRHGLAAVRTSWPRGPEWPDLLAGARERGGAGWARWNRGDGAARAARAIEAVLRA